MTPAPWRTGRKVGRTIYRQTGPTPSDTDPLIGIMDTPEDAKRVVDAVNAIARIRELHKPKELSNGYSPFYVCSHCQPDEESWHVDYPCPTIRALGGDDA